MTSRWSARRRPRSEAVGRIHALDPDVAVLDVRLAEGNGIEACREIRSRNPRTACLMLTSFADDEALFQAIMAGASGYVLKQIGSHDLVVAIRRVAAGQNLLDPVVTARVLERIRRGPDEDERLAHLTAQERNVLDLLAEGMTNRADRRAAAPGREDDQELRHGAALEDGDGSAHRGRGLRRPSPAPEGDLSRPWPVGRSRSEVTAQRQTEGGARNETTRSSHSAGCVARDLV